ncbi:uncharacterized protein LOC110699537 [Chenopodium quinoa]|uniref:uncharacterized protein LOC110699537 n=1 Tax=Chenopodium quinoa TaxID=63459 RepID=UPI000B798927|nr:uncharacterized protein LOC110699537 [Chenopodium quinoa]
MTKDPNFNFHPRCEKLGITHFMFVDDLLLFARADLDSVKLLFMAFQKFSMASGLCANLDKSDAYFGGISDQERCELQQVLGMANGNLLFRYLGVPLSSKKLTISDCRPLIERVTGRIDTWATKHLSYAGILQLVKSVLFGIQDFWAQIFVLPKKIIREMESRFRCFLWSGKSNPTKKALVAWRFMCLPKTCGGWNINSLEDWNKVAVTKVLWDLASKSDNLWVKWVHIYYFAGKNLWTAPIPKKASWILKKILASRDIVNNIVDGQMLLYSKVIKASMLYALGFTRSVLSFTDELQWIIKYCRKTNVRSKLIVMCFSEADYNIWM